MMLPASIPDGKQQTIIAGGARNPGHGWGSAYLHVAHHIYVDPAAIRPTLIIGQHSHRTLPLVLFSYSAFLGN